MTKFLSKKMTVPLALLCVGISPAEEPENLPLSVGIVVEEYANKRADGITRLGNLYVEKLEAAKTSLMKRGDLVGANAAEGAIGTLRSEIDSLDSSVYRDRHEGLAGLPGHNKETTYTFEVLRSARTAKLVLNVQIIGGVDSRGDIVWKAPNAQAARRVGTWSGSSKSPIVIEIPGGCRVPGNYSVEFQYSGGDNPLKIYSGELHTGTGDTKADGEEDLPATIAFEVKEYTRKKADGITRLNKLYIEKLEVEKTRFMKAADLDGANATAIEIAKLDAEIKSLKLASKGLSKEKQEVEFIAKFAGKWKLATTGAWRFSIHADGLATSTHTPNGKELRGRIEVIDLEQRIIRITGLGDTIIWKVGENGESMSGTGIAGGYKHPAERE